MLEIMILDLQSIVMYSSNRSWDLRKKQLLKGLFYKWLIKRIKLLEKKVEVKNLNISNIKKSKIYLLFFIKLITSKKIVTNKQIHLKAHKHQQFRFWLRKWCQNLMKKFIINQYKPLDFNYQVLFNNQKTSYINKKNRNKSSPYKVY